MSAYSALVEVGGDGWCTVWLAELPGFFLNEATEEAALAEIPDGAAAYLRWLQRHGERTEAAGAITYAIAERVTHGADLAYGEYHALFDRERVPPTDGEIEQALRWMGHMRRDLLALVDLLPPGAMEWRRTPDHRFSVGGYLEHVARAERWYLSRIWADEPPFEPGPTPLQSLTGRRDRAAERLRAISAEDRTRLSERDGELWTARKALGRFLYHERYHIRSIARIARERGVAVPDGLAGWHRY